MNEQETNAIQAALEEVEVRSIGITKQFFDVHDFEDENPVAQVEEALDDSSNPYWRVYLNLRDADYYWLASVYEEDGETVCKWGSSTPHVSMSLSISSDILSPGEIEEKLRLEATAKNTKGSPRRGPLIYEHHQYHYRPSVPDAWDFEQKLDALIDLLRPRSEALAWVSSQSQECGVSVGYAGWQPQRWGCHVSREQSSFLGEMGLSLDIDLYANGPPMGSGADRFCQLENFARCAEKYCEFVEIADSYEPRERVRRAIMILSELIHKAMMLQEGDAESPWIEAEIETPETWLGFDECEYYWVAVGDVYDEAEIVAGSLSDDFLDIYRDLKRGLIAYNSGDCASAEWQWRFSFETHWSSHAANALTNAHLYAGALTAGSARIGISNPGLPSRSVSAGQPGTASSRTIEPRVPHATPRNISFGPGVFREVHPPPGRPTQGYYLARQAVLRARGLSSRRRTLRLRRVEASPPHASFLAPEVRWDMHVSLGNQGEGLSPAFICVWS